jgi:GTP-binding protein
MQARFLKSAAAAGDFPAPDRAEVAVVGRSNSGKSSAINRIVGQTKLARVSKTPGRTQLINFFDIGPAGRLVDLPGYGFARVPGRVREDWRRLVGAYFDAGRPLAGLVMTVDCRRGLLDPDRQMHSWAAALAVPLLILLTKADKLSRGAGASRRLEVERELDRTAAASEVCLFSALDGTGLEAARARLAAWLAPGGAE